MPRKTNTEKDKRGKPPCRKNARPRPKPKIDFTEDRARFQERPRCFRQYVTDQGRILPAQIHRHARALPAAASPRPSSARAPDAADEVSFTTV